MIFLNLHLLLLFQFLFVLVQRNYREYYKPDKKDRIWFGTENGLYQIIEKNNIYFLKDYSKISRYMRNSITSINEDKSGNLWIGTYGDGAYKFDQKSFERFDFNQELYKQTILDIIPIVKTMCILLL